MNAPLGICAAWLESVGNEKIRCLVQQHSKHLYCRAVYICSLILLPTDLEIRFLQFWGLWFSLWLRGISECLDGCEILLSRWTDGLVVSSRIGELQIPRDANRYSKEALID